MRDPATPASGARASASDTVRAAALRELQRHAHTIAPFVQDHLADAHGRAGVALRELAEALGLTATAEVHTQTVGGTDPARECP